MMHQDTKLPSHISWHQRLYHGLRAFLPTPGNILFMILLISLTLLGQDILGQSTSLAEAEAATTALGTLIPYQGYLTDDEGTPLDGLYDVTFRIYGESSGGAALWTEERKGNNQVPITDGLFTIRLGELNAISRDVIVNSNSLFLGVTVDDGGELIPRVELSHSASLQPRICCGSTPTDGTGWVNYEDKEENGIYIDIDTSECQFTSTPKYFSSLRGNKWQWKMVGSNAIYKKGINKFEIYLRGTGGGVAREDIANEANWHIEWCGIEE